MKITKNPFWIGVGIALVIAVIWITVAGTDIGLPAAIGFFVLSAGLFGLAVMGGNRG